MLVSWLVSAVTPAAAQSPLSKAGWQATLSTVAHGVRGTVTVVDDDTFRVDNFYYDGGGLVVYFYLGAVDTRNSFLVGLKTGPNLLGTAYNGGSITVNLPAGQTFANYNAISVWCEAAGVSFGSGTFMPYARAGWQAPLSTRSHNVQGTVTIVDADTFRVDNFFYDGGGIRVYFYLGATDTQSSFVAGLKTGPNLLGTAYSGGSLTVDLPTGRTLDGFAGISVWCEAAGSSFGSGTFVSPRDHWRRLRFGSTANTGDGADAADVDKDGNTNLLEYATRMDPKISGGSAWNAPVPIILPGSIPGLSFTFNYRPESHDIRYRVLSSPDLNQWSEIYRNDPKTGGITLSANTVSLENSVTQTITVSTPVPSSRLFWRLVIDP
jgi:hypothetical protein